MLGGELNEMGGRQKYSRGWTINLPSAIALWLGVTELKPESIVV